MTERSWQRDFYINTCRNGILKNQTKKTTTILLHRPYILCHFANHAPYPIHSKNNHVRYTELSHTPLCRHRLSTAHLRSFHKPYLPCSASLAFSTKLTLSMHINKKLPMHTHTHKHVNTNNSCTGYTTGVHVDVVQGHPLHRRCFGQC